MTINLLKHRHEILDAYEEVLDQHTTTNWALFGYESNSNVLKFVEKGDDGIQELSQVFNSGQVMYALCAMTEPKTHMRRLVLINWQGEGAPIGRLGICATHHLELKRLFKGVHMVYTARCEEDVDPDEVLTELKKCTTASAVSASLEVEPPQGAVGTNYQRINPQTELASSKRDQFWQKTEEEEKARLINEKRRMSQEAEHYQKDKEILQKEITTKLKSPTSPAASFGFNAKPGGKAPVPLPSHKSGSGNIANGASSNRQNGHPSESSDDYFAESDVDKERRMKSDMLRQERVEEAKSLIGQRNNVRAMWESTTSGCVPSTPGAAKVNGHSAFSNSASPTVPTKSVNAGRKWPPDPVPSNYADQIDQNGAYESGPSPAPTVHTNSPSANRNPSVPQHHPPTIPTPSTDSHPRDDPGIYSHPQLTPPPSPKENSPPTPLLPSSPPPPLDCRDDSMSGGSRSPPSAPFQSNLGFLKSATDSNQSANNTIKNSIARNVVPPRPDSDEENDDQNWDDPPMEDGPTMDAMKALNLSPAPVSPNPASNQHAGSMGVNIGLDSPKNVDMGIQAQALWDYQASDETEISFDPGDIITRIEMIDDGWWQGLAPDGTFGLFPANYVELLSQ